MLILFDVDKTLIDREYRYTQEGLEQAVARAIGCGHVVGLNSDTPLTALLRIRDELGMNGPVIAERGAVVWLDGAIHPTGTIPRDRFKVLRNRVLDELTGAGDVEAILGDPTAIIRSQGYATREPRQVVFSSALRLFSLHFAARRIDGTSYEHDPELLARIERVTREHAGSIMGHIPLDWDVNPEYGILILHAIESCKRSGVKTLMKLMGLKNTIMIGDSLFDHVDLPGVKQWAVGNAAPAYLAVCERVASASYTAGAIELLEVLFSTGTD